MQISKENAEATMQLLTHIAKFGGHIRDLDRGIHPLLHGTHGVHFLIAVLPKEVQLLSARN